MKRLLMMPAMCLTLYGLAASASAVTLVPGTAVLTNGSPTVAGTIIASVTDPILGLNALGQNRFSGSLTAEVVQEAGGTLDFWYQYTNDANSVDAVERLSMSNFAGFSTDVDWLNDNTGTQQSTSADRSIDGAKVSFEFTPSPLGAGTIAPGAMSRWLVIKTDATHFTEGTTSLIDGGVATVVTFAPKAVPEPASLLTLAIGIVGLVQRRRRTRA